MSKQKQGPLCPEHIRRNNARVKIQLKGPCQMRLEELSEQYDFTVAALIRYCIDRQLPNLEEDLKTRIK